jgi:hypothetical protein
MSLKLQRDARSVLVNGNPDAAAFSAFNSERDITVERDRFSHLIISSARSKIDSAIVIPIAFAVWRFTTKYEYHPCVCFV